MAIITTTTVRFTDGTSPTFFSSASTKAYNLHFLYSNSTQRLTNPKFGIGGKLKVTVNPYSYTEEVRPEERKSLTDFLTEAGDFVNSDGGDGGPPRWFSPLECGARAPESPLLLYLPGIDGTGLGLIRQHKRLGE
jgi:hypothetical protein